MHKQTLKTSPNKSKTVPQSPPQTTRKDSRAQQLQNGGKMAEGGGDSSGETEPSTKAVLTLLAGKIENMEKELSQKLADLIKPLSDQMAQMNLNIQTVSKVAEGAMDMAMAHKDEIRTLQIENETQAEKIAILTNRQRFFNLKFRGMKELIEGNSDLIVFMEEWLTDVVEEGGERGISLTQAYRIGKPDNPNRLFPRDVVVTFADIRAKRKVVELARKKGFLLLQGDKIQVYADLAPEALEKKRELRDILAALREAKVRHRWISPITLQVPYKGQPRFIRSEEEGIEVLHLLGIPTPMTTDRASAKRKLNLPGSPQHIPRKYHKNYGR